MILGCKLKTLDRIHVEENGSELQRSHVPNPDSRWHRVALRRHVDRVKTPFNALDACRGTLKADLLEGTVQESFFILLCQLGNLDCLCFVLLIWRSSDIDIMVREATVAS